MARIAERAERRPSVAQIDAAPGVPGFAEAVARRPAARRTISGPGPSWPSPRRGSPRASSPRNGPGCPSLPSPRSRRPAQAGLYWGVTPRLVRKVERTDEMIGEVEAALLGDGMVRTGDIIVIISGAPMWVAGTTNLLKLHRVGERR